VSDDLPNVIHGMEALRRDNPWPEPLLSVEPFYLSLDAGGRHLVTDLIQERGITLMLEVGSFLCGSAQQWLAASRELVVIGVDPWDGNWAPYMRKLAGQQDAMLGDLPDPEGIADTIQRYGNYAVALNNMRDERDRFIPVRRRSPEAFHYLQKRGVKPQMVYIDAFKTDDDLWKAHEVFPDAILCGDDWTWRDDEGRFLMREHVESFVAENPFQVEAEGATWVLSPMPLKDWDAAAAGALVTQLDGDAGALLRYVASAAASGAPATFGDAARALDRTTAELFEAAKLVNEAPAGAHRVQVLGLADNETQDLDLRDRPFTIPDGLVALLSSWCVS
jgi:hypothetical protein